MPHEKQVTLNEQIEQETGVPVPEDTIPIELPKPKRQTKMPGHISKFIHIPDNKYELIKKHIEAHDLDEGRFLTRQLSKIADELK